MNKVYNFVFCFIFKLGSWTKLRKVTLIRILILHIWLVKVSLTSYFISLVILVTWIFGGKLFCSLRYSIIFHIVEGRHIDKYYTYSFGSIVDDYLKQLELIHFYLAPLPFIKVFILTKLTNCLLNNNFSECRLIDWLTDM